MPLHIWATKGGNQKIASVLTIADCMHQKFPTDGCWIQFYIWSILMTHYLCRRKCLSQTTLPPFTFLSSDCGGSSFRLGTYNGVLPLPNTISANCTWNQPSPMGFSWWTHPFPPMPSIKPFPTSSDSQSGLHKSTDSPTLRCTSTRVRKAQAYLEVHITQL
jgi:hypothetical protein